MHPAINVRASGANGARPPPETLHPVLPNAIENLECESEIEPLHRAVRALLFTKSVWVLYRPTYLLDVQGLVRRGVRFIVLIRED